MEDDKGLLLSLGLACGRASSPSKDMSGNSADDRMDTDDRTSKILNDFRNFLNAGVPQSFQRTDPVKPQENFFNNFRQTASGGAELSNGAGADDNKRKRTFVDMENHAIKQETDSYSSDLQVKEKHSHISITTDEESAGDNDDVAESEAEGSTSRMASHREDGSRTPGGSASSSQAPKEINGKANISASSFSVQTVNASSVPYSITIKESPSASSLNTSVYPLSMESIPPTTGGYPPPHVGNAGITGSVPMSLTYSSLQISDEDSPWGMARPQPLLSPYTNRFTPTSASMQVANPNSSEAARPDVGPLEQLRGPAKVAGQVGPSSRLEGDAPAARSNSSFPSDYPAIKSGIAAEVKLGGSSSFPNLPWVSTTGPGPNGKTISGVTYKFNATQIKIVCACHGVHLSPEEFILHATQDQSSGLASLRSSNPATTSAKS